MEFTRLIVVFALIAIPSAFGEDSMFIPEASGVCQIANELIITGDEESQSLWVYTNSAKILKIKVHGESWDDMEALASFDNKNFFAVTSHSRTKKGLRKAEREKLILMTKNANQISILKSWTLRDLVVQFLEKSLGDELDIKSVKSSGPNDGGLNIEGMAYWRGVLYLGLRSPLTRDGKAIILSLTNVAEMLKGANPSIGEVLPVDLEGRGIRGLDSNLLGILILSGSQNDVSETFGLFQYIPEGNRVEFLTLKGFESLLRPEGVVTHSNGIMTFVQDFEAPQVQDVVVSIKR